MDWSSLIDSIEPLEGTRLDPEVMAGIEAARRKGGLGAAGGRLDLHVPSFKHFESSEIPACSAQRWPAVSVTGGDCALQCDHCRAEILKPMLPARTPAELWRAARDAASRGARGLLLSGGSNRANEVVYEPFLEVIRRIKDELGGLTVAVHTGLLDDERARGLEQAGVDVAMLDIIGSQDTLTRVYHLKRSVDDFEEALAALGRTRMRVVPHVVVGLHYGCLLGEWRALEMIARQRCDALVLVVAMPFYASPRRPFATPDPHAAARLFLDARQALPDLPVLLGCARPPGAVRVQLDIYAVLAGLDGIAHPSDGVVELARRLGREVRLHPSCCSIPVVEPALAAKPDGERAIRAEAGAGR